MAGNANPILVENFISRQRGTIAATSTSQRIAFSGASVDFTICNTDPSAKNAFIEFGDATVVATAGGSITAAGDGSQCVPAGVMATFRFENVNNITTINVAAVCAGSDTTILRISQGSGS